MNVEEKRIPFPCHPKKCWALSEAEAPPKVFMQCGVCGKIYEIDTVKGTMQRLVPENTQRKARLLYDTISDIVRHGDEVLIRGTPDGGMKVRRQSGRAVGIF